MTKFTLKRDQIYTKEIRSNLKNKERLHIDVVLATHNLILMLESSVKGNDTSSTPSIYIGMRQFG